MTQPQNALAGPQKILWYNTLFFRVIVLCGVLLLCLLGSVIVLTRFYFNEAAEAMRDHAEKIGSLIQLRIEEGASFEELQQESESLAGENELFIQHIDGQYEVSLPTVTGTEARNAGSFQLEHGLDGSLTWVAELPLLISGQPALMTLRVPIEPQDELLRAFTNRYMLMLTLVFVFTLAGMVYLIVRSLRPLTKLSDTCAAITEGKLDRVHTRGAYGEIRALEETFNRMVESLREKEMVESKLRQAQRLSALGNLAAGVAHDVRNPLNAIKLLSSHAQDMLPEESIARRNLGTIREEVNRLESIVSSFLSLAKETELKPEPLRVDTLLDECVQLFQSDADERGVKLAAELRAGDAELLLDEKQWKRAILNILLNALEACPPGGRVRVFSRVIERGVQIEIRDDGPGLPRHVIERVFDPYYTTKPGGTGLGLSITRGIIEEHDATIEITSNEGQGVQVLITVPFEQHMPAIKST